MLSRRLLIALFGLVSFSLTAADWPQWRGPNRDAKVSDFKIPVTWPKELKQEWRVEVGDGAATPALVGNMLFIHTREGGDEVVRCLDASNGKEIWQQKYAAQPSTDPAHFEGPRSSPAVADGKIVTLGARGMLSCFDAESGKKLWSKDEFRTWPQFFVASSPIIVDGLCIAQLGGENNGSLVAYDLTTGTQKWQWREAPTAYASPMLMTAGGMKLIIAQVGDGIAAINAADGTKVWDTIDRGRYNAVTPIVDGDTLIYLIGSAKAVKFEKDGDKFIAKNLWTNPQNRLNFNTPILKDGMLIGLSERHELFCFNTQTGKTPWTAPLPRLTAMAGGDPGGGKGKGKGGFGKGGGGGMRADAGYGSIVDAGSVLMALIPSGQLLIIGPSGTEFKQLASYKVSDKPTYAYPIVAGNRIYIKDKDSVTLWTVE